MNIQEGLILRGSRIFIPQSMRKEILDKIHAGHQGITKCRERAKQAVWWPGVGKEIEDKVMKCTIYSECRFQHAEPNHLFHLQCLEYPWQKVATDLFHWKNGTYLLVIHHYSRYIEIAKLTLTT